MIQQLSLLPLSKIELKIIARVWLDISTPSNFLELVSPQYQESLKQQFIEEKLIFKSYNLENLTEIWELVWQEQINLSALKDGYKGFKLSDNLVYNQEIGTVINLNLNSPKPFMIQWQLSNQIIAYNLYELRQLKVSKILPLIRLSSHVVYQISEDQSLFKVWIGFKSKKLASLWLRQIKQQIGKLSQLIFCHSPELIHTGKKYEYLVEDFKHKTISKRLEILIKIAETNLDQFPN